MPQRSTRLGPPEPRGCWCVCGGGAEDGRPLICPAGKLGEQWTLAWGRGQAGPEGKQPVEGRVLPLPPALSPGHSWGLSTASGWSMGGSREAVLQSFSHHAIVCLMLRFMVKALCSMGPPYMGNFIHSEQSGPLIPGDASWTAWLNWCLSALCCRGTFPLWN